MTEGGLATWKVSEGSAFSAGDVLLEIETDKATMDVEAQDDGVMAKIVVQAGEKGVPVGKMIAILAEEGDDLSKAESEVKADEPAAAAPKGEEPSKQPSQSQSSSQSSPPSPSPSHSPAASQPAGSTGHSTGGSTSQMFPSVSRLLAENNISSEQASQIKGSGIRGMLTKGDVLVHLGKADSPTGSYKRGHAGVTSFGGPPPAGKGPAEKSSSSANSAAKASEPKVSHRESGGNVDCEFKRTDKFPPHIVHSPHSPSRPSNCAQPSSQVSQLHPRVHRNRRSLQRVHCRKSSQTMPLNWRRRRQPLLLLQRRTGWMGFSRRAMREGDFARHLSSELSSASTGNVACARRRLSCSVLLCLCRCKYRCHHSECGQM